VDYRPEGEKAAIVEISGDGTKAIFDPASGFIDFPGGAKKFTIRFDPVTKMYWTLSNPVLPRHKDPDPGRVRNAVALMRSMDLRKWEMRCIVLYHPDVSKHGFQYLVGLRRRDMIVASRRPAKRWPLPGRCQLPDIPSDQGFRSLTEDSVPGARDKQNPK
jgi:hypothetical protein